MYLSELNWKMWKNYGLFKLIYKLTYSWITRTIRKILNSKLFELAIPWIYNAFYFSWTKLNLNFVSIISDAMNYELFYLFTNSWICQLRPIFFSYQLNFYYIYFNWNMYWLCIMHELLNYPVKNIYCILLYFNLEK